MSVYNKDEDIIVDEKHPIVGFILTVLLLAGCPIFWIIFFKLLFNVYETNASNMLDYYTAVFLGSFIGFLMQLISILKATIKDSRQIAIARRKKFLENCKVSFSFAIKCHFYDIKEYGIGYFIYSLIIFSTFITILYSIYGIITC